MTIFGDRVRAERTRLGLTARELSRAAGRHQDYACEIEIGRRRGISPAVEALTNALGLSLADLLLEGPELFELEYAIGGGPDLPPSPEIEALLLGAVPPSMVPDRVAVWPWTGDGCLRLRARASCLPRLIALAGVDVPGLQLALPAPTVRPVSPCADLAVLVRADGPRMARRFVLAAAGHEHCCPPVDLTPRGASLWLARLRAVPASCSVALQRLAPDSPIGLFVPVG